MTYFILGNLLYFFGVFLKKSRSFFIFAKIARRGCPLNSLDWSVFGLKPSCIPHTDYQAFILQHLRGTYEIGTVLIAKDWPLAVKFWMTDLSALTTLLRDEYRDRGSQPRDPALLFRSYLLLLMTNPQMELTEWVTEMQRTPIYALLSGFLPHDLPGVGTFYDFFYRLWPAVDKNLRSPARRRRKRKKKEKKRSRPSPPPKCGTIGSLDDASYG
jgi:hypothetical protein